MNDNDTHRYDDIIGLPHHQSATRPRMPMENRAAQFAPFAALTGHDELIGETGRLTSRRTELSDDERLRLSAVLRTLVALPDHPELTATYFRQDETKAGGRYLCHHGRLKRVDTTFGYLEFEDGMRLELGDIADISSPHVDF